MEHNDKVKKDKYTPLFYLVIILTVFFVVIYLKMFGLVDMESKEFIEGTIVYVIMVLCLFSLPLLIYFFFKSSGNN